MIDAIKPDKNYNPENPIKWWKKDQRKLKRTWLRDTHIIQTINEKKLLRLRATDDKSRENFISLSSHFKSIRRQMFNTAVNHFRGQSIYNGHPDMYVYLY